MSNLLKIYVRKGDAEINYEQTAENNTLFAATSTEGYSKGASSEVFFKTISLLCKEVKVLAEEPDE